MKRWRMALKLVAAVLGGVLIYKTSSITLQDSVSEIVEEKLRPEFINATDGKNENINKETSMVNQDKNLKGSEVSKKSPSSDKVWTDFKYQNELSNYAAIQAKVFLSEDETEQKKAFLRDQEMLRSFKSILLAPAPDMVTMKLQNAAIDLLFDALAGDPQGASLEVLKDVISNPLIEDSQLNSQERQAVAEIKAEILFRVSAALPESRRELESLLPGPVSQRLWKNVVAQQKSNLAESALERAR